MQYCTSRHVWPGKDIIRQGCMRILLTGEVSGFGFYLGLQSKVSPGSRKRQSLQCAPRRCFGTLLAPTQATSDEPPRPSKMSTLPHPDARIAGHAGQQQTEAPLPPKRHRPRASLACDTCKTRKTRCDGRQPVSLLIYRMTKATNG